MPAGSEPSKNRPRVVLPDNKKRFSFAHAWQKLAAMDLVDEDFEFEILTALRIRELRGVTQGAIASFSLCAAMIFQRVVAVVAAGGLDHSALRLDFAAGWNEFKQRIGDEFSLVTG
jgi:hypothetical protein